MGKSLSFNSFWEMINETDLSLYKMIHFKALEFLAMKDYLFSHKNTAFSY